MSRNRWIVPLLLATGVILADDVPEAGSSADVAETPASTAEVATVEAPPDEVPEASSADVAETPAASTTEVATVEAPPDDVPEASSADVAETPASTTEVATVEAPADEESEGGPSDDAAGSQEPTVQGAKEISGMSVLGNREAPKSLVIVPWKSSKIGESVGISMMLDDSRTPVDREVFLRALTYYEIRSEATP